MKISVITPSYNSSDTIERAINSVLCQEYKDYEHIIVDGASTDHTPEILRQYSHLKWVSEPDNGQVEAMNKGFRMSLGDVIVYLNADDYFLKGAFSSVIPHFRMGEEVVMGKVLVRSQEADGFREWINDPKTDIESMLYHWEADAFCVNPVGYFYRRAVQEEIPFNKDNDDKHDLEFLIEVALHYEIKRIDTVLGVFDLSSTTKTAQAQSSPKYWRKDNFSFIDRTVHKKSSQFQKRYHLDRERGYQLRRRWAIRDAASLGLEKELIDTEEAFFFPEGGNNSFQQQGSSVTRHRLVTKRDWVVPVLAMDEHGSKVIFNSLKLLPQEVLPADVFYIRQINRKKGLFNRFPMSSYVSVEQSFSEAFNKHKNDLDWKFIVAMREPISCCLSSLLEMDQDKPMTNGIAKKIQKKIYPYKSTWFDEQIKGLLGIDIHDHEFDRRTGYSIIKVGNIEVLLYRMENLPQIFSQAMEEFLGIPGLTLLEEDITSVKTLEDACKDLEKCIKLDKVFLDEVYSTNLLNYFYTDKEISEFYERWTGG